jgi:DNA recombination protein RmuC
MEAARAEALARSLDEQRALLDTAKTQLGDTFQAMAGEALRASQKDFLALASEKFGAVRKETSAELETRQLAQQKAIEGMVGPVRASLEKMDAQVRAMELERGTAYGAIREQMQTISATQEKLRDATGNLVTALRAPAVRGRWGEIQLRRVVEHQGLRRAVRSATSPSGRGGGAADVVRGARRQRLAHRRRDDAAHRRQ